jgi:hypothetical protein
LVDEVTKWTWWTWWTSPPRPCCPHCPPRPRYAQLHAWAWVEVDRPEMIFVDLTFFSVVTCLRMDMFTPSSVHSSDRTRFTGLCVPPHGATDPYAGRAIGGRQGVVGHTNIHEGVVEVGLFRLSVKATLECIFSFARGGATPKSSPPRRRGSRIPAFSASSWIPASAGMTAFNRFAPWQGEDI